MTLWRSPIGQSYGIANISGAWQGHFDGNRCGNAQFGLIDVAVVIRIGCDQHRRCGSGGRIQYGTIRTRQRDIACGISHGRRDVQCCTLSGLGYCCAPTVG